jgi:hypothetical protein
MPYNYYQLTRVIAMTTFLLIAYDEYKNRSNYWAIIWFTSAIVINPIFKISLNKKSWNVLDIIWIVLIILSICLNWKNKNAEDINKNKEFVDDKIK